MVKECAIGECDTEFTPRKSKCLLCDECFERTRVAGTKSNGERTLSSTVKGMLYRAKDRGKHEVSITHADIYEIWPINNKCPIMGTIFTAGGERKNSPSLDRINPDQGYVKGNIQIICDLANKMKQNATDKELQKFCAYYLKETQG